MSKENILNTEQALTELLKELGKLKTGAEQIATSREGALKTVEVASNVIERTNDLLNSAKIILNKLEGLQLKEQYDSISALLKNLEGDQKLIVPNLMDFLKQQHEFEKGLNEQGNKIASILAAQSKMEQRNKFWMGILGVIIVLQVVIIVISTAK